MLETAVIVHWLRKICPWCKFRPSSDLKLVQEATRLAPIGGRQTKGARHMSLSYANESACMSARKCMIAGYIRGLRVRLKDYA